MVRAVEEGALMGYRIAFKHTETPTEDAIVQSIVDNVMLSVSEVFVFQEQSTGDSYK